MTAHQYDDQVNQLQACVGRTNGIITTTDSNVYGFAPNFGCCTANYHQGWPKFVRVSVVATSDDGLSAVSYAPCTVRATAGRTCRCG